MAGRNRNLAEATRLSLALAAVLALVFGLELLFPPLAGFGVAPRTWVGLRGVVFSPLLHASLTHLLANIPPLVVLLVFLFWDRHYQPWRVLGLVWIASGLGTWLIGRGHSTHIGASSIIYGLASYIIVSGVLMGSWRGLLVGLFVFLAYGGIFYGVLPHAGPVSWEGHLSGAIAGVWAAKRTHV